MDKLGDVFDKNIYPKDVHRYAGIVLLFGYEDHIFYYTPKKKAEKTAFVIMDASHDAPGFETVSWEARGETHRVKTRTLDAEDSDFFKDGIKSLRLRDSNLMFNVFATVSYAAEKILMVYPTIFLYLFDLGFEAEIREYFGKPYNDMGMTMIKRIATQSSRPVPAFLATLFPEELG